MSESRTPMLCALNRFVFAQGTQRDGSARVVSSGVSTLRDKPAIR